MIAVLGDLTMRPFNQKVSDLMARYQGQRAQGNSHGPTPRPRPDFVEVDDGSMRFRLARRDIASSSSASTNSALPAPETSVPVETIKEEVLGEENVSQEVDQEGNAGDPSTEFSVVADETVSRFLDQSVVEGNLTVDAEARGQLFSRTPSQSSVSSAEGRLKLIPSSDLAFKLPGNLQPQARDLVQQESQQIQGGAPMMQPSKMPQMMWLGPLLTQPCVHWPYDMSMEDQGLGVVAEYGAGGNLYPKAARNLPTMPRIVLGLPTRYG